jgi:hypothetical protein
MRYRRLKCAVATGLLLSQSLHAALSSSVQCWLNRLSLNRLQGSGRTIWLHRLGYTGGYTGGYNLVTQRLNRPCNQGVTSLPTSGRVAKYCAPS